MPAFRPICMAAVILIVGGVEVGPMVEVGHVSLYKLLLIDNSK